jgi:multidrug resistance efflux pump
MRGKWLLAAGTLILLAVAAGALSLWRRSSGKPAPTMPPAPPVLTAAEVTLPGKIRAQHIVPVGVPVDGTIEFLGPEPGQEVYEGELLARIKNQGLEVAQQLAQAQAERAQTRVESLNSSLIAARLEASRARADASRAQTEAERAEKAYLRQQILQKEGAARRLEFEKAEKEYQLTAAHYRALDELARQAERRVDAFGTELDNARRLLEDKNRDLEDAAQDVAAAEILSPVNGIVVARSKTIGDEVTRDLKDLYQIAVDLSLLEAVVEPEPPVLARLRPGQDALVILAEAPGNGLPGTVREVKTGEVVIEFTSPSPAVHPGLTAQVRIKLR